MIVVFSQRPQRLYARRSAVFHISPYFSPGLCPAPLLFASFLLRESCCKVRSSAMQKMARYVQEELVAERGSRG